VSDIKFEDLVGKRVNLCGVDNNVFCIEYRGKRLAFEAVEDECDGYRSCMEELRPVPLEGHIFFDKPVARADVLEVSGGFKGYIFLDVDTRHEWLKVGTDEYDDHYLLYVHVRVDPEAGVSDFRPLPRRHPRELIVSVKPSKES
jgi:hypothetical protein